MMIRPKGLARWARWLGLAGLAGLAAWKFGSHSRIEPLVGLQIPPFTVHGGEVFYSQGSTLLAQPVAGGVPRAAAEGIPHYLTYFPVPELGLAFRERPDTFGRELTGNAETIHFLPWSNLHHFRIRIHGGENPPVITGSNCYWVQDNTHRLLCQRLDGEVPQVIAAGLQPGAAVEAAQGNAYWTLGPPSETRNAALHYRLADGRAGTIPDAIGSEQWTAPIAVGNRLFWLRERSEMRPIPGNPEVPVMTPVRTELLSIQSDGRDPKSWVHLEESAQSRERLWMVGSVGDTLYVERETVKSGSMFSIPVTFDLCRLRPAVGDTLEKVTTLPSAPVGWLDDRCMYFAISDIHERLWASAGRPERVLRYVIQRIAL